MRTKNKREVEMERILRLIPSMTELEMITARHRIERVMDEV